MKLEGFLVDNLIESPYNYINGESIFDNDKKEKLDNRIKNQFEIEKLKRELATYDYIGVKISMGVSTREEYADKIAYTETLREKIRELESKLAMQEHTMYALFF